MRILITTGIFEPESGGPATYTPQLAAKLVALGHKVTVITYSDREYFETDTAYHFKLVRVVRGNPASHKATTGLGKILGRLKFFLAVYMAIHDSDVVYTLDWFAAGLPVAIAAWITNKPYVVRIGGDYLWEQKYLESGQTPVSLKDFYEYRLYARMVYMPAFYLIRAVLRGAVQVVFNSDAQRMLYARYYNLNADAISTIYNPIPHIDAGVMVRDAPSKEIVYWGRLIVMKNIDSLIRAFGQAALPAEYTLAIIGDGPQKAPLLNLIKELHLEGRVHVEPAMSKEDALRRVRNARAYVLPSWTDISPNQVYEALKMKLPALVTKENYLPVHDQLPDMVDPRSVEDIAEKLKMLADDGRYAVFAADFNAIHFDQDWDKVVNEHMTIFDSIIAAVAPAHVPAVPSLAPADTTVVVDGAVPAGLRILQIGADRSKRGILYPDSPAVARQVGYGEHFDSLDIIGFSLASDTCAPFSPSPKVHIYPTNSMSRLFYGLDTIRIARRLSKPDAISVQDPFETGLLGMCMAIVMGVPFHVQVHTDLLAPAYARHSLLNRVRVFVAWIVLPRAARIRVVSDRIKKSLEEQWKIRTPITVLPIFADIERMKHIVPDEVLSLRFSQFKYKLLVVARLEAEKNVALAIHAFAQVAPAEACLIVVGDGSDHGHLVTLAHMLKIADKVFFENEKDALPYYATADLVLVPSLYEGYGLVIVEALAAGKPVISTDVGVARSMGATIAEPSHFAQALAAWFAVRPDIPRATGLANYPYKNFEEYAKAYAQDIAACTATDR
ncbi:glycosyltransferase [Candidatus Kaiserbacteria bacterium]|nr:glycosyltransferase [Candidatus Kaiserbacteria bacterium]